MASSSKDYFFDFSQGRDLDRVAIRTVDQENNCVFVWQEGPTVCTVQLRFLCRFHAVRGEILNVLRTALQRVSSWSRSFQFDFSESRLSPTLRAFFVRAMYANVLLLDGDHFGILQDTPKEEPVALVRYGSEFFATEEEARNASTYVTAYATTGGERLPFHETSGPGEAFLSDEIPQNTSTGISVAANTALESDAFRRGGPTEHDPTECSICFLDYDADTVTRTRRPCCRQFLCIRCDNLCHDRGRPCAFCRAGES